MIFYLPVRRNCLPRVSGHVEFATVVIALLLTLGNIVLSILLKSLDQGYTSLIVV